MTKSGYNEIIGMTFSEELVSAMGLIKRTLPGDLECLTTGSFTIFELGRQVYICRNVERGYSFMVGINREQE